jgi:hypothetical protein
VLSPIISYFNKEVKTSGEPDTLRGNSFLNAMIIAAGLIDENAFKGLIFKGDDSTIFIFGNWVTVWANTAIKEWLAQDGKTVIADIPEFCNHIYFRRSKFAAVFFYNYVTIAKKILSRNFEEATFAEYQRSVFDLLMPWFKHKSTVEAGLSQYHGIFPTFVHGMMQQIHAFTKVEWSEFSKWLTTTRLLI